MTYRRRHPDGEVWVPGPVGEDRDQCKATPRQGRDEDFRPRDFRRGLRHANVDNAEYRVAVELCEFARIGQPMVWPSNAILADACGMTPRGVVGILRRLEAKGVIVCGARSKGGRGHTTHWRLVVLPAQTGNGGAGFTAANHERRCTVSGRKTMNGGALNHERAGGKTMNGGSSEVEIEVEKEAGNARANAENEPPTFEPHPSGNDPSSKQSANSKPANASGGPTLPPLPPPWCSRHPGGTDEKCGSCKQARLMHERAKAERERAHTAAYQAAVEEVRNCDDGCDGFGRVDVEAEGQSAVVSCGCAKRITLDELSESRCAERQGIPGDEQAFGDGRNDLDSAERAALEARADRIMREAYDR